MSSKIPKLAAIALFSLATIMPAKAQIETKSRMDHRVGQYAKFGVRANYFGSKAPHDDFTYGLSPALGVFTKKNNASFEFNPSFYVGTSGVKGLQVSISHYRWSGKSYAGAGIEFTSSRGYFDYAFGVKLTAGQFNNRRIIDKRKNKTHNIHTRRLYRLNKRRNKRKVIPYIEFSYTPSIAVYDKTPRYLGVASCVIGLTY